jgi:hypothetical protein
MDVTSHDLAVEKVVGLIAPLYATPMLKTRKISSTADGITVKVLVGAGVTVRVFVLAGVTVRVFVLAGVTVPVRVGTGVNGDEPAVRIGGVVEAPYAYL